MIGYIYMTTNLINNKIYIGQKYSNKFIKSYLGSGKIIKQAIKKYGRENFKVKIIYKCKTIKRLDEAEKVYIEIYDSTNPRVGYNISFGGHTPMLGRKHDKKSRIKISVSNKGKIQSKETKIKISHGNKGKHFGIFSEDHKQKISDSNIGKHNYWSGKHLSEEHKKKVSESMKNNSIAKKKIN
jgi:group I intron endonuclease